MKNRALLCSLITLLGSALYADNIKLIPISYNQLPGWINQQNTEKSFSAFKQSCVELTNNKSNKNKGTAFIPLTTNNWAPICQAAKKIKHPNQRNTKAFFQQWFTPVKIIAQPTSKGLFTGYYLPSIPVQTHYSKQYATPIYGRPNDLITVKLSLFKPESQGQHLAGHIIKGRLYPYNISRAQINQDALKNKAPILLWAKNRADRFFLQVQGSGIAKIDNKKSQFLGYDGDNGEKYYPIGRWFIQQGIFDKHTISMKKIYHWLITHPKQANKIMNLDASFVFFKLLSGHEVFGTENIPLTPGYSLAVDNYFIPLGLPVWVTTTLPATASQASFKRLLIAQDTGGAIKGPIRGDIYFGAGNHAEALASEMKGQGELWLLIPKK